MMEQNVKQDSAPPTELPELIKAKLRAPAVVQAGGMRAALALVVAWLHKATAVAAGGNSGAVHTADAKISSRLRQNTAVLRGTMAGLFARSKLALPQLPAGLRETVLERGRRAGVQIGTALDTVIRPTPTQPVTHDVTEAATTPIEQSDITTIAVQRAVARPSIFGPWHILTAVLTGGIIHIATTFAVISLGTGGAYRQMRGALPANQLVVFPALAPNAQILPYLAPDMLYAICRFDLATGPVVVTAQLPDVGWSLALYTRNGDNFYAVPGVRQRPAPVAVLLQPVSDRLLNLTPGTRRTDADTNEVTSPDSEGLMVIRAPLKGIAYEAAAMAELKKATCRPVAR